MNAKPNGAVVALLSVLAFAAGNLVLETDARGVAVRRSYDEANRLVAEWDESSPEETRVVREYDGTSACPEAGRCTHLAGMPASVRYPAGLDAYGYDARGRPVYAARVLAGHMFATVTAFDNADRVVGRRDPDGRELAVTLDGAGRVTAVPPYVARVDYDEQGLPSEEQYGNGVATSYTYDARLRLATLFGVGPGGQLQQAYRYRRDRV